MRPEGLIGVVLRDARIAERELDRLGRIWPELLRQECRVLTTTSGLAPLSPNSRTPSSLFTAADASGLFSRLALGEHLRLFRSPWSENLLWFANRLLAEDGELLVPFVTEERARRDGKMSRADIEAVLGARGEPVDDRILLVRRSGEARPAPSLLRWFVSDVFGLLHNQLLVRGDPSALRAQMLDSLAEEMLIEGWDNPAISPPGLGEAGTAWLRGAGPVRGQTLPPSPDYARILRSNAYLMSGLNRKLAGVRTAASRYGGDRPGALVDIGGALGFVGAEALLDPQLDIRTARTVEYDAAYAPGALHMYRALRPEIRGRFEFAVVPAQEHEYDLPITVATLFSSLLYVPRDGQQRVLDGLWDTLEPGGVMVVYEALKTDPPSRHDAVQFTAREIDGMLARYGEVHRMGATAMRELTAEEAGEDTVFRIVVKRD